MKIWRKLLCAGLSAALVCSLAGCKGEKIQKTAEVEGITCTVKVNYGDLDLEGLLQMPKEGAPSVELTSPPSMKGLRAELQSDGIHLSYQGLRYTLPAEKMPITSFAQGLFEAMEAVKTNQSGTQKGDSVCYNGECSAGQYEMTVDGKTGLPTDLALPGIGFSASLCDYQ